MDTSAFSDALVTLKVIVAFQSLASLVSTLLAIASFFRRQPSIDATLTALVKEFNAELQTRVLVRDFDAADARHTQHVRDVESRFSSAMIQMENRMDQRLSGMHTAIVDIRGSLRDMTSELSKTMQDLYNDRGWTRGKIEGAAHPPKGCPS